MADPIGILIVTLDSGLDVGRTKKKVLEMKGVTMVDYNYLTQKLTVRCAGDDATVGQIDARIKSMLKGKSRTRK